MFTTKVNLSTFPSLTLVTGNKRDKKPLKRFYKHLHQPFSYMGLDTVFLIKKQSETFEENADGEIIASAMVSKLSAENTQYFLHALLVSPAFRGQGLARILLQQVSLFISHLQEHCHDKNNRPINLIAFADKNLQVFYQQQGYLLCSEQVLLKPLLWRYNRYLNKQANLKIFKFQI